ncbi:MAG: hypothetical protein LBG81_00705 [Coriobacteriaceae bacterium]|jgi:hypothetical protein|nr:hypothetical protein [Coriobacteriaceae bacterium]
MTDTIHVDKDVLEAQIARLEALARSAGLSNFCRQSITPIVSESGGRNVEAIKRINDGLEAIVAQMYVLIGFTVDVLKNVRTSFIEADEGLAARIGNG